MATTTRTRVQAGLVLVAALVVLATLAGPARAFDKGTCDAAFGNVAKVVSVKTFAIDTGTVGQVDFGDLLHIGGAPQGTAVVCFIDNGRVFVKGLIFADWFSLSGEKVSVGATVSFHDSRGGCRQPKGSVCTFTPNPDTTPFGKVFSGNNAESSELIEISPPGLFYDKAIVKLTRSGEVVSTTSYSRGLGKFRLAPAKKVAAAGVTFPLHVTWIAPRRWRDLKSVDLELVYGGRTVATVRFHGDGTKTGRLSLDDRSGKPGQQRVLTNGALSLLLAQSSVTGSGPTGKSVTIDLALRAEKQLAGNGFELRLGATDADGTIQPSEHAGSLTVRR